MDDLIKRADAIEAVGEWMQKEYGYLDLNRAERLIDALSALPSADAVQGEWKHTITGQPYCSNCEYVFGEDEEFSPFWKYCPMCGARMRGGAE